MQLKELATASTGFPFRKRIENDPDGQYAVIQMSDIQDYQHINTQHLAKTSDISPKKHHFIQNNDILFIAKGANNLAIHANQQLSNTVAVSNFLVIRTTSGKMLPEFLAWYINQKEAQTYFKSRARGTYIPAVTKETVLELEIPLPDIRTQQKTIALQQLLNREWQLMTQIHDLRSELAENRLLKLSHGR